MFQLNNEDNNKLSNETDIKDPETDHRFMKTRFMSELTMQINGERMGFLIDSTRIIGYLQGKKRKLTPT